VLVYISAGGRFRRRQSTKGQAISSSDDGNASLLLLANHYRAEFYPTPLSYASDFQSIGVRPPVKSTNPIKSHGESHQEESFQYSKSESSIPSARRESCSTKRERAIRK